VKFPFLATSNQQLAGELFKPVTLTSAHTVDPIFHNNDKGNL
jgi:hypothetical protein